jgi:hypothetical protein
MDIKMDMATRRRARLAFLALGALAAFTLSACGAGRSGREAYALYTEGAQALRAVDAVSLEMGKRLELAGGPNGMQLAMTVSSQVKQTGYGESLRLEAAVELDYFGQPQAQNAYYADGYFYQDLQGQKLKRALAPDALGPELRLTRPDLPRRALTGGEAFARGDDAWQVKLAFRGDRVEDALLAELSYLEATLAAVGGQIVFRDVNLEAELDHGVLTHETLSFTAVISAPENDIAVEYAMDMAVLQQGGTEVSLPEDLEAYVEIGPSA